MSVWCWLRAVFEDLWCGLMHPQREIHWRSRGDNWQCLVNGCKAEARARGGV